MSENEEAKKIRSLFETAIKEMNEGVFNQALELQEILEVLSKKEILRFKNLFYKSMWENKVLVGNPNLERQIEKVLTDFGIHWSKPLTEGYWGGLYQNWYVSIQHESDGLFLRSELYSEKYENHERIADKDLKKMHKAFRGLISSVNKKAKGYEFEFEFDTDHAWLNSEVNDETSEEFVNEDFPKVFDYRLEFNFEWVGIK